ncbi:hypothetical protein BA1DRAFT_04074 [Photorhabdus aegyptia]|uniref:Uncharacterized protein n=1 Tax=Photorhabdus aegyptia TaxID=2805098 RepID=A0A022PD54_9GAMM|nr:hypothetical protein BA1DRAFT_04074 [Photorhabdus aegyptia]
MFANGDLILKIIITHFNINMKFIYILNNCYKYIDDLFLKTMIYISGFFQVNY